MIQKELPSKRIEDKLGQRPAIPISSMWMSAKTAVSDTAVIVRPTGIRQKKPNSDVLFRLQQTDC
jgi:hypothetical protein